VDRRGTNVALSCIDATIVADCRETDWNERKTSRELGSTSYGEARVGGRPYEKRKTAVVPKVQLKSDDGG